jgi:hypothetical protein
MYVNNTVHSGIIFSVKNLHYYLHGTTASAAVVHTTLALLGIDTFWLTASTLDLRWLSKSTARSSTQV